MTNVQNCFKMCRKRILTNYENGFNSTTAKTTKPYFRNVGARPQSLCRIIEFGETVDGTRGHKETSPLTKNTGNPVPSKKKTKKHNMSNQQENQHDIQHDILL